MSLLQKNIFASYASTLYCTVAGILVVPLYFKYMGAEAYGLVGFFAMLQVWFNLLDLGLTSTISRESARFNGGAITLLEYLRLARALESLFVVLALLGGLILFALAEPIARQWLNATQLPVFELVHALQIMAIIVALRWMCGFYRGVISGSERLVLLSVFNGLIATGRFVLVLPVLIFISAEPKAFFIFQLGVAVLELAGLSFIAYQVLPRMQKGQRIIWKWAPLKPVVKFSMSIGFTTSVWVLVTQTDKLVLSSIISLSEYGYFTVAVLVASGIMMLSSPISGAIMPHLARLQAEEQYEQLLKVYRNATQQVTVIAIPTALILILFSEQVLWAWTGDAILAEKAGPVLSLYAAGYGFLAIGAFPFYLQYAKGNLKLHMIGNILFVLFMLPSMILAAKYHGILGAGWSWLIVNIIFFFLWTPIVHRKFAQGIHLRWLINDILKIGWVPLIVGILLKKIIIMEDDRALIGLSLILLWIVLVVLSSVVKNKLKIYF